MTNLPVDAELLHADRETDGRTDGETHMTKLIFGCRNFAKALKNNCEVVFWNIVTVNRGK